MKGFTLCYNNVCRWFPAPKDWTETQKVLGCIFAIASVILISVTVGSNTTPFLGWAIFISVAFIVTMWSMRRCMKRMPKEEWGDSEWTETFVPYVVLWIASAIATGNLLGPIICVVTILAFGALWMLFLIAKKPEEEPEEVTER